MIRNLIVLPDGREVFSGSEGSAVMALERTEAVNTDQELMPGAVCAQMLKLTLLDRGDLTVAASQPLTLYTVDEAGSRTLIGTFLAEQPVQNGHLLTVTAYDRLILLDQELTGWLGSLNGWPYTLQEFCRMVFAQCGLEMEETQLPNGEFPVEAFHASAVTGRQLISWAAEAAGCFCRMTPEGKPALQWYTPAPVAVGAQLQQVAVAFSDSGLQLTLPGQVTKADSDLSLDTEHLQLTDDGNGNLCLTVQEALLQQFYYQNTLAPERCVTAPIERIQLRQTEADVGTVYPDIPQGNTLAITGNPLLAAKDAQTLLPVAQTLFAAFQTIRYTPCTLALPYTQELQAGQILTLTDKDGNEHPVYIMELTANQSGMQIRCTGSARRQSSRAVNNQTLSALNGKMLQLRTDVDGLQVQHTDNAGKLAQLKLDLDGIQGQVSAQSARGELLLQQMTTLEQSANALKLTVEKLQTGGASKLTTAMGYTFDDSGLHIAASGQQMENLLDNTGMYVKRAGQTILQANQQGVTAADVAVRNYLIVGDHARLEDYETGRTACFYLGGEL